MSLRSIVKGWVGEAVGTLAKKILLDPETYFDVNNVTLRLPDGSTTQIDHVIVSPFGIFVVEAKNMDGWIFGDAVSAQWTQVIGGKRFRFQNPLRQNYRHVRALCDFLGVGEESVVSLVMFWGDASFKTEMPPNVMNRGYASFIKGHTVERFTVAEAKAMAAAIREGMMPKGIVKSFETRKEHLRSLDERHVSGTSCPKCGKDLVKRVAKSGANAGKEFFGCSGFPACRYVRAA